jgi:2-iminobutanoate/2-iminopropanoate deaminase
MPKKVIGTASFAPISPAVIAGNLVFCSGQTGNDPVTGKTPADVETQTKNCLDKIAALMKEAGLTMNSVVRTTVYLTDIKDFQKMNGVYKTYFKTEPPARATVEISALASPEYIVEIDAVALKE